MHYGSVPTGSFVSVGVLDAELEAAWGASLAPAAASAPPLSPSRLKRPPNSKYTPHRSTGPSSIGDESETDWQSDAGNSEASGYTARGVAAAWMATTNPAAQSAVSRAKANAGRPSGSQRSKLSRQPTADRGGGAHSAYACVQRQA
eukprot:SAG31_NODE_4827_length_2922_cov_1.410556_4_plen_146_part_00